MTDQHQVQPFRPTRPPVINPIGIYDTQMFEQFARIGNVIAQIPSLLPGLDMFDVNGNLIERNMQPRQALGLMCAWQAKFYEFDPFAYAAENTVIRGRLMKSGKLVAAILKKYLPPLEYDFFGERGTDGRGVIATGPRPNDGKFMERRGTVGEWKTYQKDGRTTNPQWMKLGTQDSMLIYRVTREWGRWYAPEYTLGLISEDEMDDMREEFEYRAAQATPVELSIPSAPPRQQETTVPIVSTATAEIDPDTGEIIVTEVETTVDEEWTEEHIARRMMALVDEIERAPDEATLAQIEDDMTREDFPRIIVEKAKEALDLRRKVFAAVARHAEEKAADEAKAKALADTEKADSPTKPLRAPRTAKKVSPPSPTGDDTEPPSAPASASARGRLDDRVKIEGEDSIRAACEPLLFAIRSARTPAEVDARWADTVEPFLATHDIGDWEDDLRAALKRRKSLLRPQDPPPPPAA